MSLPSKSEIGIGEGKVEGGSSLTTLESHYIKTPTSITIQLQNPRAKRDFVREFFGRRFTKHVWKCVRGNTTVILGFVDRLARHKQIRLVFRTIEANRECKAYVSNLTRAWIESLSTL